MSDPSKLNNSELHDELRAPVAARKELGPDMEDEVLSAFLTRVDQHIDARMAQHAAPRRPRKRGKTEDAMGGSMAIAIPLVIVAGIFGGTTAIIAVVAGLVLINLLYFIDRWRG